MGTAPHQWAQPAVSVVAASMTTPGTVRPRTNLWMPSQPSRMAQTPATIRVSDWRGDGPARRAWGVARLPELPAALDPDEFGREKGSLALGSVAPAPDGAAWSAGPMSDPQCLHLT